jgi:hypothetical protein
MNAEYDISVLSRRVSMLTGMLIGSGAAPGQIEQVLKIETGQLAGRMGDAAGPKTAAAADKKITKEMKAHLAFLPMGMNLNQESESYSEFHWLYTSPYTLVGVNNEDNQLAASGEDALAYFRAGQKLAPRGKAYETVGHRGVQTVVRMNRVLVSKSAFNQARKIVAEKSGQLRAACYAVAKKYVPSKRVPAWIAKKIPTVEANGKSKLQEGGMGTPAAFIEMTIKSPGVVSNDRLAAKFQGAIKASQKSIEAKLKKLAKGAKYVFETGAVYFEK